MEVQGFLYTVGVFKDTLREAGGEESALIRAALGAALIKAPLPHPWSTCKRALYSAC